jgi:serine/threonine-protein kinase
MLPMRPCSACGFEHPEGVVICPSTQQVIGSAVVGGRYRLDRLIAVGGIGAVYDSRALHIDRRVAVKRLLPVYTSDPEVVRRFQREARAAGRIEHPNVVEVLDFGVGEDGVPFLVMEFLEGDTLAAKLEQAPGQRLPFDELVPIMLDVLEALGHAHSRGIIHRDLKPENIFLAHKANGATVVKLVDLGISKAIGSTSQAITQSGSALGTPHYMAPEQLRGEKDVDGRVDLYALGIVMYRALSGAFPFDGRTFEHLVTRILDGTCAPLSTIVPGLPMGLSEAVAWTMSKDREQRTPTAETLAAALLPFAPAPTRTSGSPHSSSPPSGHGAARLSQPSSATSPSAVPGTPAGVGGAAVEPTTQRRTSAVLGAEFRLGDESFQISATLPSVAASSQPPRRGARLWLVLTLVVLALGAGAVGTYFLLRGEQQPPPREHPPSGGLAGSQFGTPTDDDGDDGDDAAPPTTAEAGDDAAKAETTPVTPGADAGTPPAEAGSTAPDAGGGPPGTTETGTPPHDAGAGTRDTAEARASDAVADRVRTDTAAETATPAQDAGGEPSGQPTAGDVARLFLQVDAAVRGCAGEQGPGSYRVVAQVRGTDGHVTGAHVVSELSAESVECVRRLVAGLSFPPFGDETASFDHVFGVPGPAAADAGTATSDGAVSIERLISRILRQAKRRALLCVAGSTGSLTLLVRIDGTAHQASLQRINGSVTPEEEACLRGVVETTEVPVEITGEYTGVPFEVRP